jgi:hypothetical protein
MAAVHPFDPLSPREIAKVGVSYSKYNELRCLYDVGKNRLPRSFAERSMDIISISG